MADTSIYSNFLRPIKSVADYDAEAAQAQDNALAQILRRQQIQAGSQALEQGRMKADEYTRGLREAEQLRSTLAGLGQNATDEDRIAALKATGLPSGYAQADALQKALMERAKTGAIVAKDTAEADSKRLDQQVKRYEFHVQKLGALSDPSHVEQWLRDAVQSGIFSFKQAAQGMQAFQQQVQQPGGFEAWKQQALRGGMSATQQIQAQAEAARQAETGRHNKASEGIQIRGQNLIDARAREANSAAMSRPFEVTGPDGSPILVQQDKQGNIKPVEGYTPKGAAEKPLPQAVLKQVTEARDNAITISRLARDFKPDFAGKGVFGLGAETQMGVSGNIGVDRDAVEWWKNYRKQAELIERHALFGAALTPTEQASWRSADIGPGMDAGVIERNLTTRARIAKKVAETTKQDLIEAGHSSKRIEAIAGRGSQPLALPSAADIDAEIARRRGGK